MEEKGSISLAGSRLSSGFQSSTLLTSVRLQFLAGCFGLGTVGQAGAKGESGRLHHYQVGDDDILQYIKILTVFLQNQFYNFGFKIEVLKYRLLAQLVWLRG